MDALLGELEDVEQFCLSAGDVAKFDTQKHRGMMSKKLTSLETQLRAAIREAADAGETKKISVSNHLRSVLADLRAEEPAISAYLFQSVFAFGDKSAVREEMSGDSQQDCFLYYNDVLTALNNDPHTADADKLSNLFGVELKEQHVCANQECKHTSAARTVHSFSYQIPVPRDSTAQPVSLETLFVESMSVASNEACPKCEKPGYGTSTELVRMPPNLVVRLNRLGYDVAKQTPLKAFTTVKLDEHRIEVDDDVMDLNAVICHKGPNAQCGHYTIFRKLGNDWYHIDDKSVKVVAEKDVRDSPKVGQMTMLLYRKQQK